MTKQPTNIKHWVVVVPMLAGPKRNAENIKDELDKQGEDWVLVSTEIHEDYLYMFLVLTSPIQAVEVIKP